MLGVVVVLALAALLLAPAFVRRRRRRRRLHGDLEDLLLEIRDRAIDLGLGWPAGRSPRATGAWLARQFGATEGAASATRERPRTGPMENPVAVRALDRLVEQLERSRYSRSGVSVDRARARADAGLVLAALEGGVTRRVRRQADWLPRSLWTAGQRTTGSAQPTVTAPSTHEAKDSVGQ